MKKRLGVNGKALLAIIVFSLIFGIITCVSGSLIFDRTIKKLYNDNGYVIANIILNDIDHDRIANYAKTWEPDDYYPVLQDYMDHVEEYTGAAYIYIAVPSYEDKTLTYIYDSSDVEMGFVDPISASIDEIWKCYTQGERPKSYLIRRSKLYGYLTSSCLPVKDSQGNIVALLFVDIYMQEVLSTLNRFIVNVAIITMFLLLVFCIMNWKVMQRNFITPITIISRNVKSFAANNAKAENGLEKIDTGDEIEDLAKTIGSMEKSIVNYIDDIKTITAEKERIGAELNVATKIQADMLPRIFPPFPDKKCFDVFATMDPAKEVGGDFYDFFLVDDDHLCLVLADVSGKGVPAALFMVIAKTLIKNRANMGGSPSEILEYVNNQLCEGNDADLFVTVWLAIVELSTGKGVAANAGHEHPALKRAGGDYELSIYKHSSAVATFPGIKFIQHEFQLYPGDSIFVYTDGVLEATNKDNKLFKSERMLKVLNDNKDCSVEVILHKMKGAIDEFVGEAPQFDDITMLIFNYYGQ